MTKATTSPARLKMIEFIKSTRTTSEFKFNIVGDTETAKRFIQRMRNELSRMRNVVIESGKVPKEFKVILIEIKYNRENNVSQIILAKQTGVKTEIADEVGDIFDDIAGGGRIE